MIQVIDGKIEQYFLPKTGKLSTGETVSGYHLLDPEILEQEGWLPLEDNPPEHDPETEQLINDGYEILEDKVVRRYLIIEYVEPRDFEKEIDELRNIIDILLGGEEVE